MIGFPITLPDYVKKLLTFPILLDSLDKKMDVLKSDLMRIRENDLEHIYDEIKEVRQMLLMLAGKKQ